MSDGLRHLIEEMENVRGPVTGKSPQQAALPVAEVDLDIPLGDHLEALDELSRLWLRDAAWFHDPRSAAHLNCPVVIPALVADLLASAVNTSMDTFDQSIGATFMERHLLGWLSERVGFDDTADGVFTSGGSASNLQALFCARGRANYGGVDARSMRILASQEAHFSVQKAARLMGLRDEYVIRVPTTPDRRMNVVELARLLDDVQTRGWVAVAVVGTAGTTDFGAIDPLREIGSLCRDRGTWFHVDAAYGGGLLVSPRHRHLLEGIELADSVTVDFHKTFYQPVASSAVVLRDGRDLAPVTWRADYLNPLDSEHPNQVDKSLQTTRRFDAVKLWMTLRVMGPEGIGDYVDATIDLTQRVHAAAQCMQELEVAAEGSLTTVVFRYTRGGLDEERIGALNRSIRAVLFRRGSALVAGTKVDGRQFLKLTLLNPLATHADVMCILHEIIEVGDELLAARNAPAPTGAGA